MTYDPLQPYDLDQAVTELEPILTQNKLAIFVGSGASVAPPSGLPTWDELMTEFIKFCRDDILPFIPPDPQLQNILDAADTVKLGHPEQVASTIRKRLEELEKTTQYNVAQLFTRWMTRLFAGREPNINHELIVGTNYQYILTTNYDYLLEDAARTAGYGDLVLHSYTFHDAQRVASAFYERQSSIIHVHGTFDGIPLKEIVLTAEDYTRIKRAFPGFRSALTGLFTQYSILFVGYGGSDPHLEDFIEEIAYHLDWPKITGLPRYFLALSKDKVNAVLSHYKAGLRTEIIALNSHGEMTELLRRLNTIAPK